MSSSTRITLETIRGMALALPEVAEGTSYGTPAFRVGKKLIARFHEDGESLVVRCTLDQREALLRANPEAFFVTDHYLGHPWVLVHLSAVDPADLGELLEQAWRDRAPKRLLEARGSPD